MGILCTNQSAMLKPRRKARFLEGIALMAICMMLVLTNLLAGCACFRPTAKRELGTSPGKEGQIVEVHEEMPWPCKAFWGIMWVLCHRSTPEERRAKEAQEHAKLLDPFNQQYREANRGKASK